ncbi:MAG: DUF2007 domain-containing protein [Bacteroidetes bacterium]|nr:DUF2007 domain-containing protein [Bacteroidota bacterium]
MKTQKDLIRIYTGTEVSVILLKGELEEKGISSMIKNDFRSGNAAGFFGGIPSAVDLFIRESDAALAEAVVSEFVNRKNT